MHGKRILLAGRDLSRDRTRSWVEPACNGDEIVAAASKNLIPNRIGDEHRSIWELRPLRRQLTHPPAHSSDESPRLLPDGSILFVRTVRGHGALLRLRNGKLTHLADVGRSENSFGHYDWTRHVAVWP
jgi:hypothetical protein